MCAKVLEDLCDPQRRAFYPLRKLQQVLYRAAAGNPDFFFLKVLETIPVMKLWQRRLKKEARRRSVEIIADLGIPHPEQIIEQYPHNLSGGMKQRIVIAMALDVSQCRPKS
jgi:ABC-type dipeptide/oligopeptide/nickel transport system ATPase component